MKPFEASGAWLQKASKKNDEKNVFFFPPGIPGSRGFKGFTKSGACMLTLKLISYL
jgi:hypothetical protein